MFNCNIIFSCFVSRERSASVIKPDQVIGCAAEIFAKLNNAVNVGHSKLAFPTAYARSAYVYLYS